MSTYCLGKAIQLCIQQLDLIKLQGRKQTRLIVIVEYQLNQSQFFYRARELQIRTHACMARNFDFFMSLLCNS